HSYLGLPVILLGFLRKGWFATEQVCVPAQIGWCVCVCVIIDETYVYRTGVCPCAHRLVCVCVCVCLLQKNSPSVCGILILLKRALDLSRPQQTEEEKLLFLRLEQRPAWVQQQPDQSHEQFTRCVCVCAHVWPGVCVCVCVSKS